MYHHIIYKVLSTGQMLRFVRVADGNQWDNVAGSLKAAATFSTTCITIVRGVNTGGMPITIPAALPAGSYDMLVYDVAAPAYTDAPIFAYRIEWSGSNLIGYPQAIGVV